MSNQAVIVDRTDRVAVITLNRPEVLNALNLQLVRELDNALTEFEHDDGVGAIVITGAGRTGLLRRGRHSTRTGR